MLNIECHIARQSSITIFFETPCITEIDAQNNLVVVLIFKKINTRKTVSAVIIYIVIETRQEVWA